MKEPYLYIRAWGIMLRSSKIFIDSQVKLARQENAPATAIYRHETAWVTFEEIGRKETSEIVERVVIGLKIGPKEKTETR